MTQTLIEVPSPISAKEMKQMLPSSADTSIRELEKMSKVLGTVPGLETLKMKLILAREFQKSEIPYYKTELVNEFMTKLVKEMNSRRSRTTYGRLSYRYAWRWAKLKDYSNNIPVEVMREICDVQEKVINKNNLQKQCHIVISDIHKLRRSVNGDPFAGIRYASGQDGIAVFTHWDEPGFSLADPPKKTVRKKVTRRKATRKRARRPRES